MVSVEELLKASANAVVVTDIRGNVLHINQRARRLVGLNPDTGQTSRLMEICPSLGSAVLDCSRSDRAVWGDVIETGNRRLLANISPIRRAGLVCAVLCSFQDMDDLEQTFQKLDNYKRLNKELETIIHNSADGIWVYDGSGYCQTINRAAEVLDGVRSEDIVGMHYSELPDTGICDIYVAPEVFTSGKQVNIVSRALRTNKTLLVTGTPAYDDEGNLSLVVVNTRDLTELAQIQSQLEQSRKMTERFREELVGLTRRDLSSRELVADSKPMREVMNVAARLAEMGVSNILILGDSGTGKGLLAKVIHNWSRRKDEPFIQINCAAMPESLLEAELFGYEKGAFTGAREQGKVGLIELAGGGTLFLDEIGDMSLSLQAKLLTFLDNKAILPLGGVKYKTVECSVIAATNRDLEQIEKEKRFRRDLYYRLNSFTIKLSPLRMRRQDIPSLANLFLKRYNKMYGLSKRLGAKGLALIMEHHFPGNVRELESIVKNAVVLSEEQYIDETIRANIVMDVPKGGSNEIGDGGNCLMEELQAYEKHIVAKTARKCSNIREVAAALGLSQTTAFRKLRKHGVSLK
jgi:PAS domain S-box-containing protein